MKNKIKELQQRLKIYTTRGRWKHDNFHLTMKFLGEISPSQQIQIDDALRKLCIAKKPFSLKLTGLGKFEGKDTIRVLWLGLTGDIQELHSLHKEINKVLDRLGFPLEKRKFSPHITIGQNIIFECPFDQIKNEIEKIQFDWIEVDNLFLFKSEQVGHKRVYSKISEYDFSKGKKHM